MSDDSLQALPHSLKEKYSVAPNNVSLIGLQKIRVLGVLGKKEFVRKIAANLALQLAALYCYTDVKLCFVMRPGEENYFAWARPLPHARWQENKIRLMCANETERQNVLFYLNGALRVRAEAADLNKHENIMQLPHVFIFCTHPDLISRDNISRFMSDEKAGGVTFVLLYEKFDLLPNECTHVIQWDGYYSGVCRLDEARDNPSATKN